MLLSYLGVSAHTDTYHLAPLTENPHLRTSMCIRDIEPIRYSRYVDDCCSILLEAAEFPTDVSAVQLARIHGLAYKIARTFSHEKDHNIADFTAGPIGAGVRASEADLLQLKSSFPKGFHHNGRQTQARSSWANLFSSSVNTLPCHRDLLIRGSN